MKSLISLISLLILLLLILPSPSTPYNVPLATQLSFSQLGHASLPSLLPLPTIKALNTAAKGALNSSRLLALQQKLSVILDQPLAAIASNPKYSTPSKCKYHLSDHAVAFLQLFNLHRTHPPFTAITRSKTLASVATTLLDCPSVRLYQDSLFLKRPEDGPTNYHSDLRMAPFDTNDMVTFWIPFSTIPSDGTGLIFADKSHNDFALNFWDAEGGDLTGRYSESHHMPLALGDATAHHGWCLHATDGFPNSPRLAYTISYVNAAAVVRKVTGKDEKGHGEDEASYREWIGGVKPGRRIPDNHPHIPVIPC